MLLQELSDDKDKDLFLFLVGIYQQDFFSLQKHLT